MCTFKDNENGWSPWSEWTHCSVTCGRGGQQRGRSCNGIKPACAGPSVQTRSCMPLKCDRKGRTSLCVRHLSQVFRVILFFLWLIGKSERTNWKFHKIAQKYVWWDKWILEIGIIIGNTLSYTQCGAVAVVCAEFWSDTFPGTFHNLSVLVLYLAQSDGNWGLWSPWSACTTTCGDGRIARLRLCSNPPPQKGGRGCVGGARETQICNNTLCPGEVTRAHTHCAVV